MHNARLSTFAITATDPLDLDQTLIWVADRQGRSLYRMPNSKWQRVATGEVSDEQLAEVGLVVDDGPTARIAIRKELAKDKTREFTLVVMPSASCPHGCSLATFGGYCGQRHDNRHLVQGAYDELRRDLEEAMDCGQFSKFSLKFMGGEPLTRWRDVRDFMSVCRSSAASRNLEPHLSGKVITSGLFLTPEVHQQLREAGIANFEVTIDGPEQVHDARRPLKDGSPSFARIIRNLERAVAYSDRGSIVIRVNVDGRNEDSIVDLILELADRGVLPAAGLYVAPVRNWGGATAGDEFSDREKFAKLEIRIFSLLISLGVRPELLLSPAQRTCVALSPHKAVIAPNGERYHCTETPLSEPSRGGTEWAELDVAKWKAGLSEGQFDCAGCAMLPVCGGCCPKEWLNGGIPCPSIKLNVRSRMQLLALSERDLVQDL